jgi:hypothetical protein
MLIKFLERQYWKGLKERVSTEVLGDIQKNYKEIVKANQHWVVDKPSIFNLTMCALVLASYQELRKQPKEDWQTIIRYALIERTQEEQRFFMKLFLRLIPNPFAYIVKISKAKQVKHYGDKLYMNGLLIQIKNMSFTLKSAFITTSSVPTMPQKLCPYFAVWIIYGETY